MTLEEAQAKIAELEAEKTAWTAEKEQFVKTNEELNSKVEDMNIKFADQSKNFKKFRDMTQAEKDMYTEKELEMIKRNEEIDERASRIEKEQKDFQQKQKDAIIEGIASRLSKGDKEIADQIKINLGKLNPELINGAITEAEITPHVQSAFNMLGIQSQPDTLRSANNYEGRAADVKKEDSYADTQAGADLASAMGLSFPKVDNK